MTPANYVTESKEEYRKVSKAGEVETWFRIFATSKGGTRFHVNVREDQLDQADKLLSERARQLDSI
ncbi:hypothetical protein LCGC14_0758350 [marine sediment metagenome]|uniref:Uncharacterized protein n=1 Tax=marine sediment metagenome TaxID=412755 RepID=A0A0F9T921_9ZZZZ